MSASQRASWVRVRDRTPGSAPGRRARATVTRGQAEADKARPMSDAVNGARRRLDSMDETQRRAPAWLLASRGKQMLEILPEGTPGASPLVAFDDTFFDPRQPRETLRIATIRELHNLADGAQRGSFPQTLYLQLLQQTDWRAFAERFLR